MFQLKMKKIGDYMSNLSRFKILFIILLACGNAISQVSFKATVSKSVLGINERLRVVFEMNENGDNFIPPEFRGFNIVGGPNQAISNSWINGKRTFSKKYTYFLSPKLKGKLIIGQASIEINGQLYKTSPIELDIKGVVDITPNNNSDNLANNDIHLVAEISDFNPYINQAITIVYKLYYSPEVRISNVNEIDSPKYPDFWSHLIKIPRLEVKQGSYKGNPYQYVTWHKAVLYPQKSGSLTIDPLSLNISLDIPTNRRDFFGNRIYEQIPKVISAGKKNILVKELPKDGRPKSFNGAIGKFDLSFNLNKNELKLSESFQATVKINGKGNLKLFKPPKLIVPPNLEVYEPEYVEKVKTNLNGMIGSISEVYTIIPQREGKFPIPIFNFSYFDPEKEKYISLNSNEYTINVLNSPNSNFIANSNDTKKSNLNVLSTKKFGFIKLSTDLILIEKDYFWGSKRFYFQLFLPLAFLIFVIIFSKIIKKFKGKFNISERDASRIAKKHLITAKDKIDNKDEFYNALERALLNFLKIKLMIKTSDLNKLKIEKTLINKEVDSNIVQSVIKLLEDCEIARYSQISEVRIKDDYDNALNIIIEIDKII